MSASDAHDEPDYPSRLQSLLARFSARALRGETTQILCQAACHTASDAWGGPACVWQYSAETGHYHLRAAIRWPEGEGRPSGGAGQAGLTGQASAAGEGAIPVVYPAPWLRDAGFQYAARVPVHAGLAGSGFLDAAIAEASIGGGDAAFLAQLANLLGLALERAAEREELRTALAAKDDQLREKDLMMQEVHHRVRNSLQLVHTLLTLQARRLQSTEARSQLEKAAARIITIGAVHRRLYQGTSVAEGDVGLYLRRVLDDLSELAGGTPDRRIEIAAPALMLPADKLTPLGLITAELVTNALKYGRGTIRIAVERAGNAIDVTVEDEGPGFPPEFSPGRASGLGMRIIAALGKAGRSAIRIDRTVPHGRITVRLLLERREDQPDESAA